VDYFIGFINETIEDFRGGIFDWGYTRYLFGRKVARHLLKNMLKAAVVVAR
jgi:hypothetical protein